MIWQQGCWQPLTGQQWRLLFIWTFQEALDFTHKRWEDWRGPSRLLSYWVKEVCQSWVFCTARALQISWTSSWIVSKKNNNTALPRLSALGSKIPAYANVLITGVYLLIYSTRENVGMPYPLNWRVEIQYTWCILWIMLTNIKNILFSLVFRKAL